MTQYHYRVWHVRNAPSEPMHYPCNSPEAAAILIELLAEKDLRDSRVSDNAFGCEIEADGGWEEWYDPETGEDIDEVATRLSRERRVKWGRTST